MNKEEAKKMLEDMKYSDDENCLENQALDVAIKSIEAWRVVRKEIEHLKEFEYPYSEDAIGDALLILDKNFLEMTESKETHNRCSSCIHCEVCEWIDEREEQGCDFYQE